jgi:hypothetical protein
MMPENKSEIIVREYLMSRGFSVERISDSPAKRTADYLITDEKDRYIIEVKGRIEDKNHREDLLSGKEACRVTKLGHNNSVSNRIRDAEKQLKSTPSDSRAFRVIGLVAVGDDPSAQVIQFEATLYGLIYLLLPYENNPFFPIPCFYFTFNEFFNIPNVDAALILCLEDGKMCLNPFSPRAEEFRNTKLWHSHESEGKVCDPEQMENRTEALIADCNLDRKNESLLRDYVRHKYGLDYLPQQWPVVYKPKRYTRGKIIP